MRESHLLEKAFISRVECHGLEEDGFRISKDFNGFLCDDSDELVCYL